MEVRDENRRAWDALVEKQDRWTVPVSPREVARARLGEWSLLLTPTKPVPRAWYPELSGARVLCLAGGGGQQGPILCAAGAEVTVFDNSPLQLGQDRMVAERDGLSLRTVEGDMADLSCFPAGSFDLVFHPCSNGFAEAIRPVWREAYRVLKPGGVLLSGFANPLLYLFDPELENKGVLQLRYSVPYSDLTSISPSEREKHYPDEPLSFGHSLEDQIGGQIDAGFHLTGFYEDDWGGAAPLDAHMKSFIATRAFRPR
ncbi:MAG: methyltransferase domain-containing protein [Spirochaetes bacterium]|jgi:SAM-dependent methyltransferase|nr:methyltransferase domain-containing protein [Spirochaetota bacterium]